MVETLFYDKPHRKNMKNLQTKLYLALFLDFEYLVPLQSNEIFFRISSEKTYCSNLVKRKDLVFALLNGEIIQSMWRQLIGSDGAE